MEAYNEIRGLVDSNRLEIIAITAPARSSSTALERAISNSPDIDLQINDPWAIYEEDREANTYAYIRERINEHGLQKPTTRVLVKNIADYIPPGEVWMRHLELTKFNIFLIRNPFLNMDSLMSVMAKSINSGDRILDGQTMDEYAQKYGFNNWLEMQNAVNISKDFTKYEDVFIKYFPDEQTIHHQPQMQIPVLTNIPLATILKLGFSSFDQYAQIKNFGNWDEMLHAVQKNHELLNQYSDIFKIAFQTRITGWEALFQHIKVTKNSLRPHMIIDSTLYRADPAHVLQQVSRRAGIQFSDSIVDWRNSKEFNTDYDGDVPYYEKVATSLNIQPPIEAPISLSQFPKFIQQALIEPNGILKQYSELLREAAENIEGLQPSNVVTIDIEGKNLLAIDPLFSYILLATTQGDKDLLKQLEKENKDKFSNVFTLFK